VQPSPWWDARVHADRRPFLRARGRIRAALRRWFEAERFMEVETSVLQVSPGNETHLHAFATELIGPDGARRPLYLHTSPEFACKKLLAAGEQRIFTFAPVFRNRERGALHHPAFTMLEWYRAGEGYERLMEDCGAILRIAADAVGFGTLRFGERVADPLAPPERLTVAEAFGRHAGIDLLATLRPTPSPRLPSGSPLARPAHNQPEGLRGEGRGEGQPQTPTPAYVPAPHPNPLPIEEWGEGTKATAPDRGALAVSAGAAGIRVADDDTWGDIFSRILVERIEPKLGNGRATLLTEYPAHLAALARPRASDPRVAERFELYACGVELANAFGELTDPNLQRRRLEAEMTEKQRIYGERYPIDEEFLAALAHMPPASGAALGFDRLVMLATGASRIEQVIWTPVV
jgi:lysyl-tRNA synthetase class 2